jgi:outer membrane protein assembly factor BamB
MKKSFITSMISLFLSLLSGIVICQPVNENWTHFRGSKLDGIADVSSAPVSWTADSNIVWKTAIHGRGWSSPVVFGNQVWFTTASLDGKEMYALCVDYETGEIIHDILVFTPEEMYRKHSINSFATPTPAIENGYVYIHYGRYGTACLSTDDGSILWTRTDLECRHIQGPGSSPALYKNLLILHFEGIDERYIVALNKSSGETVWRVDRPEDLYEPLPEIGRKAYITPLILNVNGKDHLISNGSAACIAYEPETGAEIWRVVRGAETTVAMPIAEDGTVFYYTGYMVDEQGGNFSELLAINPEGEGDITSSNLLWKRTTPILQLLTPVVYGGLIYTVESDGNQHCIDAKTGEILWTQRVKGKYNSSPVYADGKIYFSSIKGVVTVLEHGPEYNLLAENQLEGEIWTTPAILRDRILIRTSKFLYLIGE